MDPAQTHSSPPSVPASTGADASSGQTVTSAIPAVTYLSLSYQIPDRVIAVPLNEQDAQKAYTRWNGQAVEINDNLYSEHICPSDLNGVPCEHDELPGRGCTLLRFCGNMVRYKNLTCPNNILGFTPMDSCPHTHDIKMSCRFVAKQHRPPHKICRLVEEKGLPCAYGHDRAKARQDAFDHYHVDLLEARGQGSRGVVPFKKRW